MTVTPWLLFQTDSSILAYCSFSLILSLQIQNLNCDIFILCDRGSSIPILWHCLSPSAPLSLLLSTYMWCIHVCMRETEVKVICLSLPRSTFLFWGRSYHWKWSFCWLDWQASKSKGSFCSCPQRWHPLVLGTKLRALCSCGRQFAGLSHLPSPWHVLIICSSLFISSSGF